MTQPPNAGSTHWSIYNERELIEHVMNERFNFFLVFYSLVIGGAMGAKSPELLLSLLLAGALMTTLLTLAITRAHLKLSEALRLIHLEAESAPSQVDAAFKPAFSTRRIVGWIIPVLCTASLWVAAVGAALGIIRPEESMVAGQVASLRAQLHVTDSTIGAIEARTARLEANALVKSKQGVPQRP